MIKCYSQRILNPYSGHVQIAESDHARAVSMDGEHWEFHFLRNISTQPSPTNKPSPKGVISRISNFFKPIKPMEPIEEPPESIRRVFARVGQINQSDFEEILSQENKQTDERIIELIKFLLATDLPFPANDIFEYWLLDSKNESPLALIYTCSSVGEQSNFPKMNEWTALPAAIMPISKMENENNDQTPPVNYRFERLVADYAGFNAKAIWFERHAEETEKFPPLLVKEDWKNEKDYELCQRYLNRQSPRLLMLQGLSKEDRQRMEHAAKVHSLEVAKYYPLYPDVSDKKIMNSIRVEAQLRQSKGEKVHDIKYRWN